jgi:hypothetical protein
VPINPSIPLQVRGPQYADAHVAGTRARQQNQLFDIAQQDRAANKPLVDAQRQGEMSMEALKAEVIGAERLRQFVEAGDFQGALADRQQEIASLRAAGLPTQSVEASILAIQEAQQSGDLTVLKQGLDSRRQIGERLGILKQPGGGTPSELATFNAMTKGMSEADITQARRVNLGLESRAGQTRIMDVNGVPTLTGVGDDGKPFQVALSTLQQTAGAAGTIANATQAGKEGATTAAIPEQVAAKTRTERFATQIDEGFAAADALPVINRAIDLLGTVKTGGIHAAALAASNLLGVTGADEAELSNNLGKAVLSQLRSTFGAAFTEREGARLDNIEANFGKSTEGNMRLLEQLQRMVEREALRGINAARLMDDEQTAEMIRESMEFSLSPDPAQPSSAAGESGAPQGVDPELWQFMTPEERALWQ